MPVYEFVCEKCQKDFELLCPMDTEVKDVKCPTCSQNRLTRKVSLFGFASGNSEAGSRCGAGDFPSAGGGCGGCGPSGCGCG